MLLVFILECKNGRKKGRKKNQYHIINTKKWWEIFFFYFWCLKFIRKIKLGSLVGYLKLLKLKVTQWWKTEAFLLTLGRCPVSPCFYFSECTIYVITQKNKIRKYIDVEKTEFVLSCDCILRKIQKKLNSCKQNKMVYKK